MEPVYGMLLALIIFGEKMTPGFYLGTLIILGTIIANVFYKRWLSKTYG